MLVSYRLLGWILGFLGSTPFLLAEQLYVPQEYPTIQAALDATGSADTVWVSPGTYQEHLLIPSHGVTLLSNYVVSSDSSDWLGTVLDGTHTGTVLTLPDCFGNLVRLQGFVIANGYGAGETSGGIHSFDSASLDLEDILFQGNFTENQGACMYVRHVHPEIRLKNILVRNQSTCRERNIHISITGNIYADSLQFDGTDDQGAAGIIDATDSLFVSNVLFHNYNTSSSARLSLGGREYTKIDNVEITNSTGRIATICSLGGGYSYIRNVHFHDNTVLALDPSGGNVGLHFDGNQVFADSIVVEDSYSESWQLLFIEPMRDDLNLFDTGNVSNLIVRNNIVGDTLLHDGDGFHGQVARIQDCNLRNSIFTGNVSQLPVWPHEHLYSIRGGVLYMTHGGLDTLYMENVEISHNILHDPDDYDAVSFQDLELILGNWGRALYLELGTSFAVFMRDCVFHENREPNPTPETDWYWSLGSTLHIFSNGWGPGVTETHIENCSFTDNDNGGLAAWWASHTIIRNSNFTNNRRYGLWLNGYYADVRNTQISGTVSEYYALSTRPSRQCAITIHTNDPVPPVLDNLTITDNECINLFATTLADQPTSTIRNSLIAHNSYQHLTAFWNNPDLDQPTSFEYCILPEQPDVGENNLIGIDPLFDEELGAPWLSPASPAIDAGDSAAEYNDLEDPADPGFALWPSQGGLRNDIGYTGGPYAGTLDHLVRVTPSPEDRGLLPATLQLLPNYPNPFNSQTRLEYVLPTTGYVAIRLYDIRGRMVKELFQGSQAVGLHQMLLRGDGLASGVYFVRVEAGGESEVRKVLLLK